MKRVNYFLFINNNLCNLLCSFYYYTKFINKFIKTDVLRVFILVLLIQYIMQNTLYIINFYFFVLNYKNK
jgi:hypothetical protein